MVNKRISSVALAGVMILSFVGLYILLNISNPTSIGPIGVLFAFLMIYIFSFSTLIVIARIISLGYQLIKGQNYGAEAKPQSHLRLRRLDLVLAVLALVPIFLVSLNSIGQLGFVDVVLVAIIETLLVFYVLKRG